MAAAVLLVVAEAGVAAAVTMVAVKVVMVIVPSSGSSRSSSSSSSRRRMMHNQVRTYVHIHAYTVRVPDQNNNNNNNNNHIQRRNSRFFTISSQHRELSPTRTLKWPRCNRVQITCNTSSAHHMQHVLHATWYQGTAQLLSLTELKSHLFELYFVG